MNYADRKEIFYSQLYYDYGVRLDKAKDNVTVLTDMEYGPRARKTLVGMPFLDMVFADGKLLIASDEKISPFAKSFAKKRRDLFRIFDAPDLFVLERELNKHGYTLSVMLQGYLLSDELMRERPSDDVRILRGDQIAQLYAHKGFDHSLCYTTKDKRRDVLAAVRYNGSKIEAIAACSNDGEKMWQIGVDVAPECRGKGYATEVVKVISKQTEEDGYCPYYCCAWSNIASKRTARSAGYVPTWIQVTASLLESKIKIPPPRSCGGGRNGGNDI